LAAAILGLGDNDRRPAETLLDAPGDDTDHALVPAEAHDRDYRGTVEPGRLRLGLFADQHLDRAAFLIQAVELDGDAARLLGIGGGQQAHAEIGFADTPAGIDPRPEGEAEIAARGWLHQPRASRAGWG